MRTLLRQNRTARNSNFVHPPNPPLQILLALVLMLLTGGSAKAQLKTYEQYAVSLKKYLNASWAAERAEFVDIQKGKKWNLIPSVGLQFGLPSINLNTGQIAAYKARQAENAAKLKSLELKYTVQLNAELNNLKIELEKAQNELARLDNFKEIQETRGQIFKVQTEAFNKRELKPIDIYREKLAFVTVQREYAEAVSNFRLIVLNIEKLAHYDMPNENIWYDGSAEFEGSDNWLTVSPDKIPALLLGDGPKPKQVEVRGANPLGN